jgi:hypothetical protein
MNAKEILLHQLVACHDEENWFVPITRAVEGLTAEQAAWHDESSNNSIWGNVNHLFFWNERYLLKFIGVEPEKFEGGNDSTFKGEKETGSDEDWKAATERLFTALSRWRTALAEAGEEKLSSPFSPSSSWYEVIADINAHTAYHLGQIIHTRKLQGSWTPKIWATSLAAPTS